MPGEFIDYGEPLKTSARREALEETGLVLYFLGQFNTYSDPDHDSRQHKISTVLVGQATGEAQTGSDAQKAGLFTKNTLQHRWRLTTAFILKIIIIAGSVNDS